MALAVAGTAVPVAAQDDVPTGNPGDALAGVAVVNNSATAEFPLSAAPRVFLPAEFAAFSPRTALDMIEQLPGFAIEGGGFGGGGGGGGGRGLGQANGNVLLNGERLATKSGSVTDQLARIPAEQVVRIEMVEGSTLNIPGLSGRVANVIAPSTGGMQVQFEWRPQLAAEYADHRWLDGIISVTGTTGGLSYTVAVEGRPNRNGNGGLNLITYGDGRTEERFSETNSHGDDKRLSASLRYETAGGLIANVSGAYLHRRFHSFDNETVIGPGAALPLTDFVNQRNRGHDQEVGGDLEFDLGSGRMKLIALDSYQILAFRTQSVIDRADGSSPFGSRFAQTSERGERIGRGEYSWAMWDADWQASFEGAFNRLDQVGELFRLTPAGDFAPIPFPAGVGGVREERFESSLSYSRPLAEGLTMQLIVGAEYSTISQTGSNALSRTFQRPKGALSLAWAAADGLDVSLRIDRRVGQLNFGDFLAAVNLGDNNQNAGNNQLRPDQSWGVELEATRDFGAWGSLTVRGFGRRFEDFVAIIPTSNGGEARGNVDWARVMGLEMNGTVQLGPLGVPGAKIDIAASLRDSRYPDPVQGGFLPVQFAQPHNVDINLRHDIPASDWAWGAGYRHSGFNRYYRVAEFGRDYAINENLTVFIEHKDVFGLTVQARVGNLLEREVVLERTVLTGPRGTGALNFSENRVREVGRVLSFTVKGSF